MKNARKKIYGIILIATAALLSGCTTEEVRKKTKVKDNLSFYPDKSKQEATAPQASSENKTPPASPVVPPNTLTNKKMYTTPPQMTIDMAKEYSATLKTDMGDIVVALAAKEAPTTVNNFVFLAREKFYDNTVFHRTIKGFMIQGGDPEGTGRGGPGYRFEDEPFEGEYTRGTVAMANAGPDTNGSQFFILHQDYDLPKNYVIFGKVIEGLDVVDAIATASVKE